MFNKFNIGRWARTIITEALMVIVLYLLIKQLSSNWSRIKPHLKHIRLGYITVAFLPTLVMLLLSSWGWTLVMRWIGIPLSGQNGFNIYYRSSLLRYLPGSWWYLPGRAYLCYQHDISSTEFAGSVFLELFFLLATAGILAGISVAVRFKLTWLLVISLVCSLSIVLVLLWPEQLLHLMPRECNKSIKVQRIKLSAIAFLYLCIWLMYGISVNLLLFALEVPMTIGVCTYTIGASAASWIVGFLSFVPTGIGIREASLVGLLQPVAPAECVVLLSVVQRTIEVFIEGCLWGIAFLARQGTSLDNLK